MSVLFSAGSKVRVRADEIPGHCRTPGYLRGKPGVVIAVHGQFRNPEKLAYHKPGLPRQPRYKVRFAYADLWPGRRSGGANDSIVADIYQHWLQADR
jgi:nitrile hydratase